MKLNPDCVRDLLIDVEENTSFNKYYICSNDEPTPLINKYTYDVILYHARYCYEAKLLNGFQPYDSGKYFIIADLSPDGHSFLSNIRSDTNWNKVKDAGKKVGSFSLDFLKEVAANVVSAAIKHQFS